MSDIFWAAIALVLIFEGLMPFVAPEFMQKMWREMSQFPANQLRWIGFGSMISGLIFLFLMRN